MNEPKATSSWSPAQRRLPPVAAARLRFFGLLALLVPLFGGLHALLTTERAPQVEVRFVPQAVPVIVEVPVERVVEVPVERVVDATATPTAPAAPWSTIVVCVACSASLDHEPVDSTFAEAVGDLRLLALG